MRTTVDIDEDLLRRLREVAHRERTPLKRVLNRTIRLGLEDRPAAPVPEYRCPTASMGQPAPGVVLDKALALSAKLEDQEISRKLNLRK